MLQQGQVFELTTRGLAGERLWAFRYRTGGRDSKRVQRGGSFLCSDLYCTRYLPGARGKGAIDSGASHLGFRCVSMPK